MHSPRLVLLAVGALLLLPAAAHGAEFHVEGNTVVFTAAPGERNDVTVGVNPFDGDANKYYAKDSNVAVTPGPGCVADDYDTTTCQMPGPAAVVASLGDGDDQGQLAVAGTMDGGPGNDLLDGSPGGPQTLAGGPGDDTISGDATGYCTAANSPRGQDTISGGDGIDKVSYDEDVKSVAVSLDDVANDGAPGEGDNVRSDVENVDGTACGTNDIVGSAAPNVLYGSGHLTGLGGDDTLTGTGGADVLAGGDGNDQLHAGFGNDTLDGGAGDDFLEGGFDDDTLTGGPGKDSFVGDESRTNTIGTGNDTIYADDGIGEGISCGPGSDVANADALDTVPVDTQNLCEIVNRPAAAGGATPAAPGMPAGAKPAATRAVSATRLKLSRRRTTLSVRLTCAIPAKTGCAGKLTVYGPKKVAMTGRKTISLASKQSRTYTLGLTKRGRALVRKAKKVSVVVQTSVRTATGVATTKQTLTLRR